MPNRVWSCLYFSKDTKETLIIQINFKVSFEIIYTAITQSVTSHFTELVTV
jgi:hypothetical protein